MKLFLLLPNIVFIIISGYNLWNEFYTEAPDYMTYKILHGTVLLLCLFFSSVIIKSVYKSLGINAENEDVVLENAIV